ncbi:MULTISPECIES: hypothetical protein [Chroococcidiopsis]|uniref:hypothetical protein n=1 Tax=Chroococcidiopsis TaxID=54298 RepID=UPI0020210F8A|nr:MULTISPECIES: hypothetical protein [Chroococcidiopsis]URD48349.1 hypothetical protein M5J74_18630 [Chroococcidiopsis sp. CCNUC1]
MLQPAVRCLPWQNLLFIGMMGVRDAPSFRLRLESDKTPRSYFKMALKWHHMKSHPCIFDTFDTLRSPSVRLTLRI